MTEGSRMGDRKKKKTFKQQRVSRAARLARRSESEYADLGSSQKQSLTDPRRSSADTENASSEWSDSWESAPGFATDTGEQSARAGETETPDIVRSVLSSPGQTLEKSVRSEMEDRLGEQFSDVQIHTGPNAAKACEHLGARAFTVGNHVVFDHGEYDPESPEGQYLLTHELVHVRQQSSSQLTDPVEAGGLDIGDSSSQFEREADEVAQQTLTPETASTTGPRVTPLPDATVQRLPREEKLEAFENS